MARSSKASKNSKAGPAKYDRHPDLPWGYWLTSIGEEAGEPPLVDEDGNQWPSVRRAFWEGRLGLPYYHPRLMNDCLEFLLTYLAIKDGRFVQREERIQDIFQGETHPEQWFEAFLEGAGITKGSVGGPTSEGDAVLLMLIATRSHEDAKEGEGLDWIEATRGLARGQEREAAADMVEEREQAASRMAHRFATDTIDGKPVIKLIGLHVTTEIPIRSTLWTMSWETGDAYARDRFYLWLLKRIDRWDVWSEMVTGKGTRALTEHLMKLAFCDRFADLSGQHVDNS